MGSHIPECLHKEHSNILSVTHAAGMVSTCSVEKTDVGREALKVKNKRKEKLME